MEKKFSEFEQAFIEADKKIILDPTEADKIIKENKEAGEREKKDIASFKKSLANKKTLLKKMDFHRLHDKNKTFLRRKLELLLRDPLCEEYVKKVDVEGEDRYVWTTGLKTLHNQLEEKWNAQIFPEGTIQYDFAMSYYDRPVVFRDNPPRVAVTNHLHGKYRNHVKTSRLNMDVLAPEDIKAFFDMKERELMSGDQKLLFEVDLNLIDKKNLGAITKVISKQICIHLDEFKQRGYKKPAGKYERSDVTRIVFHMREKIFQEYLNWYDLHIGERISLRSIAHLTNLKPEDRETFLNNLRQKNMKWFAPKPHEDRIQKGVREIYKAIHGKTYSKKEIEPYIKPFDLERDDIKTWMKSFDRIHSPEVSIGYHKQLKDELATEDEPA